MLTRWPARHIETNLTDDLQSAEAVDPINLGEVDPRHRIEIRVYVKARRVAPALGPFSYRSQWGRPHLSVRDKRLETGFNLLITCLQLLLNKIILLHRLLPGKEMFLAPVTFQCLGDRGLIVFATLIPVGGQLLAIALAF